MPENPYVVTTKWPDGSIPADDRYPVATLDEAKAYASGVASAFATSAVNHGSRNAATNQLWSLSESGGIIGPFPDGSTIKVEATTWLALADAAEVPVPVVSDGEPPAFIKEEIIQHLREAGDRA